MITTSLDYLCFAPENQYLDRKSARKRPGELLKHLIGFANADGGLLVIGVEDDGSISGFKSHGAHNINDFRQIDRNQTFYPLAKEFREIAVVNKNGENDVIVVISIEPSINRVIVSPDDVAYLREGDETVALSFERRRMLEYDRGQRFFEDEIVEGATLDDIDTELVEMYKSHLNIETNLTIEEILKARYLYRDGYITKAGILLFGKDPSRFLPQARLRVFKFSGSEMDVGENFNVVKNAEFDKALPRVIMESRDFVKMQLRDFQKLQNDGMFITIPEYPEFAWFEGIVNAVTHRDYSIAGDHIKVLMYDDHLSIESPGKLPNIVTIENIKEERFSRNPRIARTLTEFGWVREMNEGVKRIFSEMAKSYLHEPKYTEPGNKVILTLENSILTRRSRQETQLGTILPNYDKLTPIGQELVQYMYNTGKMLTTAEAAKITGRGRSTISKALSVLKKLQIVEWHGTSQNDSKQYYELKV